MPGGARGDLRDQPGARWLTEGYAGAIALGCIRQTDGVDKWLALVNRLSDGISAGLSATDTPVGATGEAGAAPWLADYATVSLASWADATGPTRAFSRLDSALFALTKGEPLGVALGDEATLLLGPPLASDVEVKDGEGSGARWRWHKGGWQEVASIDKLIGLGVASVSVLPAGALPGDLKAVMDAWPSFERTPAGNAVNSEKIVP
jgi:hypothetical protein